MGLKFLRLICFVVACASVCAWAATFLEMPDGMNSEDTQAEFFPLTELPTYTSEVRRSEGPSVAEEKRRLQVKKEILADFGNRMTPEFLIPEGLRQRTAFWFDIYTRYGLAQHVIHHALYPWVVYRVYDGTMTIENGKGPKWLRIDRANKMAKAEMARVRGLLNKLARRRSYNRLPKDEQVLFDRLTQIPGDRRRVIREAARNVRSQLGQRDFFERGLVNSSRYLPYMEEEFRRLKLPVELTRLPFVESSFNEEARSRVGASGIWQIMPTTGRAYMIVNDQIDERNSPLKATLAAGKLLHSYYRALGSWPLTITSYNHGIGNIQKAIKGARSRDLTQIIARYHRGDFLFASSNYYTCFLAALYAEKYHELIFKEMPREPLLEHEIVRLAKTTGVSHLRRMTGLSKQELERYNLDLHKVLRVNGSVPRGFRLHLPPNVAERFSPRIGTRDARHTERSS